MGGWVGGWVGPWVGGAAGGGRIAPAAAWGVGGAATASERGRGPRAGLRRAYTATHGTAAEVRNQALLLWEQLSQSNHEVQKFISFNEGLERLFKARGAGVASW